MREHVFSTAIEVVSIRVPKKLAGKRLVLVGGRLRKTKCPFFPALVPRAGSNAKSRRSLFPVAAKL
jgi:hypothetical protein